MRFVFLRLLPHHVVKVCNIECTFAFYSSYERRRDRPSDRQTPLRKSSTSGHSRYGATTPNLSTEAINFFVQCVTNLSILNYRPRSDPSRYSSRPSEQKKPYRLYMIFKDVVYDVFVDGLLEIRTTCRRVNHEILGKIKADESGMYRTVALQLCPFGNNKTIQA